MGAEMKRIIIAAVFFVLLFSIAALAQDSGNGLLTLSQQPNMFYEPEVKYPPSGASRAFFMALPWALLLAVLISGAVAWVTNPLSEVEMLMDARQLQKKSLESDGSEASEANSDDEEKDAAAEDGLRQPETAPSLEVNAEASAEAGIDEVAEVIGAQDIARNQQDDKAQLIETASAPEGFEEIIDTSDDLRDGMERTEKASDNAASLPASETEVSEQNSFLKELSSNAQTINSADIHGFEPVGTVCRRFEESLCAAKLSGRIAIHDSGASFSSMSIIDAIHETVLPLINKKSYCGLYIYSSPHDLRTLISAIAVESLRLYTGTVALVSSCAMPEDVADMLLGTDMTEPFDKRMELLRASIVKNEKLLQRIFIPDGIISFENFVISIKEIEKKSGLACVIFDMSVALEMGISDTLQWLKMLDEVCKRYGFMFFVAANSKELTDPILSSCIAEAEITSAANNAAETGV